MKTGPFLASHETHLIVLMAIMPLLTFWLLGTGLVLRKRVRLLEKVIEKFSLWFWLKSMSAGVLFFWFHVISFQTNSFDESGCPGLLVPPMVKKTLFDEKNFSIQPRVAAFGFEFSPPLFVFD